MVQHWKRKKLLFIMAICIVFTVVFADTLNADNHYHVCHDNDHIELECPICLKIEISRNSIRHTNTASVFIGCSLFSSLLLKSNMEFYTNLQSPITQKVRLNS